MHETKKDCGTHHCVGPHGNGLLVGICRRRPGKRKRGNGKGKKIAALNPWVTTPYQPAFIEFGEKMANDMGYEYVLFDSEFNGQLQYDQAKQAIEQGFAGILMSPNDPATGAKIVQMCLDAGMPLVTATSDVDKAFRDKVTVRVGVSGYYQGMELGKMAVKAAKGKGDLLAVSITGVPSLEAIQGRSEGFKDAIKGSNITLLAEQSGDFDKSKSLGIMENFLVTYDQIDVLYCHDDTMAAGAIEAIDNAGKTGDIIVIGVGGNTEGLNAIKEGKMYCTMMQAPNVEGALGVETLIKYIEGKPIDYEGDEYGDNYVRLPTPMVTIDNVDQFSALW